MRRTSKMATLCRPSHSTAVVTWFLTQILKIVFVSKSSLLWSLWSGTRTSALCRVVTCKRCLPCLHQICKRHPGNFPSWCSCVGPQHRVVKARDPAAAGRVPMHTHTTTCGETVLTVLFHFTVHGIITACLVDSLDLFNHTPCATRFACVTAITTIAHGCGGVPVATGWWLNARLDGGGITPAVPDRRELSMVRLARSMPILFPQFNPSHTGVALYRGFSKLSAVTPVRTISAAVVAVIVCSIDTNVASTVLAKKSRVDLKKHLADDKVWRHNLRVVTVVCRP